MLPTAAELIRYAAKLKRKAMTAKSVFLLVILALMAVPSKAQNHDTLAVATLRTELEQMYETDQGHRAAPHLRQAGRKGGAPLEQIQITLGHQSLETTQKYLGTDLDYEQAACDYIRINC